jgi:TonB family protein
MLPDNLPAFALARCGGAIFFGTLVDRDFVGRGITHFLYACRASYLRYLLASTLRLRLVFMTTRRCCRHLRALACVLALIFSNLYGQDSPATARAVIRKVQPQYPALAQRMSIKGIVKLEIVVEPDGNVNSLNTKGGHPLLVQAAQDAIREWKWQSASHETVESVEVRFNPQ